jgi:hypothetical protein
MLAYSNPTNSGDPNNSNNYNMMDYENAEVFLLYNDDGNDNPYKSGNIAPSLPNQIT